MEKNHYVIDYETLADCTVLVAEHYKKDVIHTFVVGHLKNDIKELYEFLKGNAANNEWHISFNGLSFDSQVTEFILKKGPGLFKLSGDVIAGMIHKLAQDIIRRQENNEFPQFSEKDLSIKQIDVFKLNHWDNPAKRSSLKWIQYSMDWHNILDMPIHHSTSVTTQEQLDTIVTYCINDVKSTKQIMNLSKDQINLRKDLTKEYGINLYSASEPRISKELFLMFLSDETGIKKYDLRNLRTSRDFIKVSDIILPYTNFKHPTFQNLLLNFKSLVINANDTKGGFKYSFNYKNVKTDFGLGGVHGCIKSGVYEAKEGMVIMTSDVN